MRCEQFVFRDDRIYLVNSREAVDPAADYPLPNGVHKPIDPKNDLAAQWVIVTSAYTA